ncbi:MAG: alpha/beta fold hydrolase [Actinomycetota bacterium]|nr:alpha/beta fold hydrolase [Actinomycetota bacterium]
MSELAIVPGAEPLSAAGSDVGVLVVHGFTGNPGTMRPLAEALVDAGFTVEMPRLPGHGTTIEDMMTTTWADWSGATEAAYTELAARCRAVVVAGLSMGGTLTAWLAARHPEVAGIVCINPAVAAREPEVKEMVTLMLGAGETVSPGIGSDIADPDAHESAYEGTPLSCALSLFEALDELQPLLPAVTCPVLLLTSPEDHVVEPASSDHLAASVSGPVERVSLDRSYHVATLDYDKELIAERTIAFVHKVTAG